MPTHYRPPADLYPFQSHWLETGGQQLHYLDEGPRDAPPVLMLHGNPTWSFYYRNLVAALSNRYRCIVPDHIGCGLSDKPGDEHYSYTLGQRVADLGALLEHLDLQQPLSLVVHDWGGMIGFAWAAQQPDKVARCVVLNTGAFRMPADKKFPFLLWLAGRTAPGGWLVRGMNAFSGLAARIAFKQPVDERVRAAYTGPYDSWANRIATLRFVQDIPLREGDPGYELVLSTEQNLSPFAEKPALIAWGELDFVFDEPFLQQWLRILPDAQLHRYPDCGHYILEDAAASLVPIIAQFLDQHSGQRSSQPGQASQHDRPLEHT
jgi:haloalkane dehalogenase